MFFSPRLAVTSKRSKKSDLLDACSELWLWGIWNIRQAWELEIESRISESAFSYQWSDSFNVYIQFRAEVMINRNILLSLQKDTYVLQAQRALTELWAIKCIWTHQYSLLCLYFLTSTQLILWILKSPGWTPHILGISVLYSRQMVRIPYSKLHTPEVQK